MLTKGIHILCRIQHHLMEFSDLFGSSGEDCIFNDKIGHFSFPFIIPLVRHPGFNFGNGGGVSLEQTPDPFLTISCHQDGPITFLVTSPLKEYGGLIDHIRARLF